MLYFGKNSLLAEYFGDRQEHSGIMRITFGGHKKLTSYSGWFLHTGEINPVRSSLFGGRVDNADDLKALTQTLDSAGRRVLPAKTLQSILEQTNLPKPYVDEKDVNGDDEEKERAEE